MRRIWNMTADAGKGKSKQHLIKMFLLLNSIVWGVIAVVVAVTLKGIGLMSSWSMAESILVSAGYGICLVGLIGGTVCIYKTMVLTERILNRARKNIKRIQREM